MVKKCINKLIPKERERNNSQTWEIIEELELITKYGIEEQSTKFNC